MEIAISPKRGGENSMKISQNYLSHLLLILNHLTDFLQLITAKCSAKAAAVYWSFKATELMNMSHNTTPPKIIKHLSINANVQLFTCTKHAKHGK